MIIEYKSGKIRKACQVYEVAAKQYGQDAARKLHQRISEIEAADSIETLVKYHVGRCHPLKGDREGQYSMHLTEPYRLIFDEVNVGVIKIRIIEVVDYH